MYNTIVLYGYRGCTWPPRSCFSVGTFVQSYSIVRMYFLVFTVTWNKLPGPCPMDLNNCSMLHGRPSFHYESRAGCTRLLSKSTICTCPTSSCFSITGGYFSSFRNQIGLIESWVKVLPNSHALTAVLVVHRMPTWDSRDGSHRSAGCAEPGLPKSIISK